jgi:hypothetical protein
LQPPQKYQPLRDEHARVAKESALKAEKQEAPSPAPDAEQEPEPTRPTQIRSSSPGWTESSKIEDVQAAAVRYDKWLNANLANRDTTPAEHQLQNRPNQAEHASEQEKSSGKDLPAADLAEAKEQKPRTMEEFRERERQQRDATQQKVAQSIDAREATPEQETQQEHSRDGGQSL